MLRQDDYLKSMIVQCGYRAGKKFGGHLASCLIMGVLAERVRLGWGSWLEVLDSVPKYSATIEQPSGTPSVWDPNFVRLLHEVEGIFDNSSNLAKGATYWFDSSVPVDNPWFQEKILDDRDNHPIVGNMNSIILLK